MKGSSWVSAGVTCGGWQWSLNRDGLVSPVDNVTYFQVIGMSGDADGLIILSWTSVDHQILIKFHKPIIDSKKIVFNIRYVVLLMLQIFWLLN